MDVDTARRLCGRAEIVVVTRNDEVVERYRLLRYSGQVRGKGTETFAVKDSTDKFFVRSDRELGLSADSPYQAFLSSDFDSADDTVINLTDTVLHV